MRRFVAELPSRNGGRLALIALVAILLVGLALRVYAAVRGVSSPGPDGAAYAKIAAALFVNGTYGPPSMANATDFSPLAPLLAASVFYVTGGTHVIAARLVVAVLGAAAVLVAYLIGRRAAGVLAGLVTALLVATYPSLLYYSGYFAPEPIAAFTVPAAVLAFLWAWDKGRWRWLVPGFLLGVTVLGRPEYLIFAPIFGIFAVWREWRRTGPLAAALAALAVVAACVVPVLPWTVRNYVVLDRFVPVSTGGGKALFTATYLPGEGRHVKTKRALMEKHPDLRLERFGRGGWISPEEVMGTPMKPFLDREAERYPNLDRDAALAKLGRRNLIDHATSQPVAYGQMLARKAWNVWRRGSERIMNPARMRYYQWSLYALALVGLVVLAVRKRIELLPIVTLVVGITIVGALLLAVPRRNVPVMPLVMVLSGTGISFLATSAYGAFTRRRGRRKASGPAATTDPQPS